ncbi:hypothetical protein FPQ18DRAFT_114991 [Pyronema domesticum]|nr:hypothetical protein FPQ18DRAFT_114991 [Pyronema domesticum]
MGRKRNVLASLCYLLTLDTCFVLNVNGADRYHGALLFNAGSFILPAVYDTLAKLWIAHINDKLISTAETYVYIGVVVEVINEGLPRAAYKVIGDKSRRSHGQRIGIANTMIIFQLCLGMLMSVIICVAAESFTKSFVPAEVRKESVKYVRISAFSTFFSAMNTAVSVSTRALDRPDVPLVISSVKTAINIILDVLFISIYRVTPGTPSINVQAIIRLVCDATGALSGLIYYLSISGLLWTPFHPLEPTDSRRPHLPGLVLMAKPGSYTFAESAIRNALYMWLISGIVSLGNNYATAWAIFNTIRWGLVMVPVYSLEATTSTFIGHAWGYFRSLGRKATNRDIFQLMKPALLSCFIALCIEIPLCLIMTFKTAYPFALYLSNDPVVAEITAKMWRSIDWCYIFYAVTTQLASVLLATRPRWYLAQSLVSNILWVLPWAIVVQVVGLDSGDPWMWHAIVFGGSLVFSFGAVTTVLAAWARGLKKGKLGEGPEGSEERAE